MCIQSCECLSKTCGDDMLVLFGEWFISIGVTRDYVAFTFNYLVIIVGHVRAKNC